MFFFVSPAGKSGDNDFCRNIYIVLAEQQSTINENMPLRFLEYISRLYEKLVPGEKRYRQRVVRLPRPEFYVFYNGTADYTAESVLRLTDAFEDERACDKTGNFPLELLVKVYNINRRREIPFVARCKPLFGYAVLVDYTRQFKAERRADWLDCAVQRCIDEGILADYLKRNSTEVRNMLIAEYDYDTDIRVKKMEAFEEGVSQGISQGAARQKAEDEKLIAQKNEEIKRLKALLSEK